MLKKELGTGVMGQVSWQRLTEVLKQSGELTKHEKIVGFQATERFLIFKVERDN